MGPGVYLPGLRNDFLLDCLKFAKNIQESEKYNFNTYVLLAHSPGGTCSKKAEFKFIDDELTMAFVFTKSLLNNVDIEKLQSIAQKNPELLELEVYRNMEIFDEDARYLFCPSFYEKEETDTLDAAKEKIRQEIEQTKKSKQ